MVRLKAEYFDPDEAVEYYFNSSVVRLKEDDDNHDIIFILFQFQCGAIEGLEELTGEKLVYIFQFQCGAIEGADKLGSSFMFFISIPVWCD